MRGVRRLKIEADKLGLRTKRRLRSGVSTGGKPFTRGHLYQLLANPLYAGEVAHKGQNYPGQHLAIIDRTTWDAVQRLLSNNAAPRGSWTNTKEPSLFNGLVYDETGDRLSPTHATKNGRRYRYYISHRLMQASREENDGWRIPAKELENHIIKELTQFLSNERQVLDLIAQSELKPSLVRSVSKKAEALRGTLSSTGTPEVLKLVHAIVERVTVSPGQLQIEINRSGLMTLLGDIGSVRADATVELDVSFTLRKRGVEAKLVIENVDHPNAGPDPKLIETVARGCIWFEQIASGQAHSVREIAQRDEVDEGDVSRLMGFAFLAPDIVEAIVSGK